MTDMPELICLAPGTPGRPVPAAFLHIPKTAGSTLTRILHAQYGEARLFRLEGLPASGAAEARDPVVATLERYRALPPPVRESLCALNGHFSMVMLPLLAPDLPLFTLLRDPVARVVSMYHHILRKPTHSLHASLRASGMSLEDFAGSDITHELTNDQTWRLAGITWQEFEKRGSDNSPELIERARAHLRARVRVVGLTERFDESLLLFQRAFDWTDPWYVRRNVAANRRTVEPTPEGALAVIQERNRLDCTLYEEAVSAMEASVRSGGPAFAAALARFRSKNRRYAFWRALRLRVKGLLGK